MEFSYTAGIIDTIIMEIFLAGSTKSEWINTLEWASPFIDKNLLEMYTYVH